MIDVERRYIEVEGRRVLYRRVGEGPPLVMLHGSPGNSAMLVSEMAAAAAHFTHRARHAGVRRIGPAAGRGADRPRSCARDRGGDARARAADWLHDQTVEIIKARTSYHRLPRAAWAFDPSPLLAAATVPVRAGTLSSLTGATS